MATNKIETFGSPLSDIVKKQFYNRSVINLKTQTRLVPDGEASGGTAAVTFAESPSYLKKHLFNSAWINLISSVDNKDPNANDSDKDSNLAKRFILSGGALAWDGSKLVKREQVNFDPPEDGTYGKEGKYNWNNQTGVRPMPGITGFRIISKNLYGTIREATVEFTVWSLPELEDIEKLYLRPGYHVIVEWGHTYGLDDSGNPTSFPLGTYENYKTFFETTPAETVYNLLEKTREKNFGNYDAFLGIVKNFSWSFRQDGGYDCSISVISKGEVLESATIRSGLPSADQETGKNLEDDFLSTNLLTKFIKVIQTSNKRNDGTDSPNEVTRTVNDIVKSQEVQNLNFTDALYFLQQYSIGKENQTVSFRKNFNPKTSFWTFSNFFSKGNDQSFVYVPLELIMYFLNIYIQISTSSKKPGLFNIESDKTFFIFDKYINISPSECIVPISSGVPIDNHDAYPFKEIPPSGSTRILDLLISLDFLYTELKNFIETSDDPEEFDVVSFIKTFLKKIESSMGGINEFDLDFSEEKNLYTIIDRRYQEEKDIQTIPTLSVYGFNSIALDLSVQTKITNKLGSQIAIAAQGPDGDGQLNSSMPEFKKWNKNLIDRFDPFQEPPLLPKADKTVPDYRRSVDLNEAGRAIREKGFINSANPDATRTQQATQARDNNPFPDIQKEIAEESIEDRVNRFYEKLFEAYKQWWDGKFQPENNYWHSIKTQGQTVYTMIASDYNTSKGLPPQGIIPTVISLKTEGIGGIKIGQTFKINKGILPKRYDDFGYIVTGIEHSIENNKWTTDINAQTYYIGKPSQEDKQKALERLNRFLPFGGGGSTTQTGTGSGEDTGTPSEPVEDNQKFWTLVAICAKEDNNPQGWADVAQSIYNRVSVGPPSYKGDIVENILGYNQYEPTWQFPKSGKSGVANPEWREIKNPQTASKATGISESRLREVAKALKDTTLQQNAKKHVGGRTDFLGANQPGTSIKLKVQRKGGNQFGFKGNYLASSGGTPAGIPGFVSGASI